MEPSRRLDFLAGAVRGHPSSLPRRAEICRVLGLEFYVDHRTRTQNRVHGPTKVVADVNRRLMVGQGASPWVANLWTGIREDVSGTKHKRISAGARPIGIVELDAVASGGMDVESEKKTGWMWFRRSWLDRRNLDPTQCAIIGVRNESIEPTLPDGCSILFARGRCRCRDGWIFVARTSDSLVVKRVRKTLATTGHPSATTLPGN